MQSVLASVYGLRDARDKKPFYIGVSLDPYARYGEHVAGANRGNSPKDDRIMDMRKDGLMPELIIFEQNLSPECALSREKFWIQYHTDLGIELANIVHCPGNMKTKHAGRKRDAMEYAIAWVKWEQTGFAKDQCPWKSTRAFRSRKPHLYEEACQFLLGS